MSDREPELSIIIPAYNEEKRLSRTLTRVRDYFADQNAGEGSFAIGDVEIIVVDDGSADGTANVVEKLTRQMPELRLIRNEGNRGKGFSVKHGMLEARGRIALFTDADLSSPIEESGKLFAALAAGNDVAIGSRALDRSLIAVRQSRFREIAGMISRSARCASSPACRFTIRSAALKRLSAIERESYSNSRELNDLALIPKSCLLPSAKVFAPLKFRSVGRTTKGRKSMFSATVC